ncbi:MAG: primosomal protein N' [Myxococcota bacterium]
MTGFAEVVVTLPVEGRFHYRIPERLIGHLEVGHRVLVPFSGRKVTGFVVGLSAPPDSVDRDRIKAIEAKMDAAPMLTPALLELTKFAASYYLAPPGEVLKVALPPGFTGASKLRYIASPEGREVLAKGRGYADLGGRTPTAAEWSLLEEAQRDGLVRKRARGAAFSALMGAGWLAARDALNARDGGGEVDVVRAAATFPVAEPYLHNAPARRVLWEAVADGPVPLATLRARMGAPRLRAPLAKLVEAGVLEVVRVAADVATAVHGAPELPPAERPVPTPEQGRALEVTRAAVDLGDSKAFLLQGVTGSGKTEVYLGTIEHALEQGRGGLVLVPEIALTPQLEGRFRARFGDQVVVLHSGIPDAERRRRWWQLREGRARIALGPRSAVWAPVSPLGVVVVDEEHDPSFKQHNELRYQGRDLALVRARQEGAVAILGSATPSLESTWLVEQDRLERLRLDARVGARPLPKVEVVDLAEERRALKGEVRLLSRALEDRLRELRSREEQAILFLNRRGFNTVVHCGACDDVKKCPRCDVSLTFHRELRKVACHHCFYEEALTAPCRSCGSRDVRPLGAGTERVVAAVAEAVPDLRILRLDRDVTQRSGGVDEVLARFRAGEADVLVGTQMVAKGHDFPRVTLVGIILADASLAFPDFRAAERTFQLLTQVAGRAGRAERPGTVVIQTLQPDHYALRSALAHDPDGFYALEAAGREDARYPPFARLGAVRIESEDALRSERAAEAVAERARSTAAASDLRVAGPAPAPIGKVRDRYRHLVLLFAPTPARLVGWMRRLRAELDLRGVEIVFDVDAVDLL